MIAKHPQKYGFENVDWLAPLDYKEIILKNKGVNLKTMAKNLGIEKQTLYDLNPAFKRGIIPKMKKVSKLRVPSYIVDDKTSLFMWPVVRAVITASAEGTP